MNRRLSFGILWAVVLLSVSTLSCGYHVGGKADLMPKSLQTIAIPAFTTFTTQYKLVDVLPQQIAKEFTSRTRFRIVQNPSEADAVLVGAVNTLQMWPVIFDPTSGKATRIMLIVSMNVTLREQATGRTLFARPNYSYKQYFDVAVDPHQYFDESGPALDRLSRDVARDLVSAIVENF